MPALLRHGVIGARGGPRPNSGRPRDAIKALCRSIVERKKLVQVLGRIAGGDDIDQVINDNGEVLKIPASIKNRIEAIKELIDRGYGKPSQVHELQLEFIEQMNGMIEQAVAKTVPAKCPHCNNLLTMRQDIGRELTRLSQALINA